MRRATSKYSRNCFNFYKLYKEQVFEQYDDKLLSLFCSVVKISYVYLALDCTKLISNPIRWIEAIRDLKSSIEGSYHFYNSRFRRQSLSKTFHTEVK